jgi:integrase
LISHICHFIKRGDYINEEKDPGIKKDAKRGTYYFVISAGYHPDGKRKQIRRTGFKTKWEAELHYDEIKADLFEGRFVNPTTITVEEYMNEWLEGRLNLKETSFKKYQRTIKNNIVPVIGSIKIQDIDAKTLQSAIKYFQKEQGYSVTTCQNIGNLLKTAFKQARKKKIIKENPMDDIVLPVEENHNKHIVWDTEHIKTFVDIRKSRYVYSSKHYIVLLTKLLTGLRRGEVLALQWGDIDFQKKVINVRRTFDD